MPLSSASSLRANAFLVICIDPATFSDHRGELHAPRGRELQDTAVVYQDQDADH